MANNDTQSPGPDPQSASTPYIPNPLIQRIAAQHGIVLPHQRTQQRARSSSAEVHPHGMGSSSDSGSYMDSNRPEENRGRLDLVDLNVPPRDPAQSSSHSQPQRRQSQPQTWPQKQPQPHPQTNPYMPSAHPAQSERVYEVPLSPEELSHRIALFLFPLFEARLGPLEITQRACHRTLDDQKVTMNRFLATIQTQYHTIAMQNEYMRSGMKKLWEIVDDLRKGTGRGDATANWPCMGISPAAIPSAPLDDQQRKGSHLPSDYPSSLNSTAASMIPTFSASVPASDSDSNVPSSLSLPSSIEPREPRTIPIPTNFDPSAPVRVDKGNSRPQKHPYAHNNRNETGFVVRHTEDDQGQDTRKDDYKRLITPEVLKWAEETFPQETLATQLVSGSYHAESSSQREGATYSRSQRRGRPPGKSNQSRAIPRLAIPAPAIDMPIPSVSNDVPGSSAVTPGTQTRATSNPTRRHSAGTQFFAQSPEPTPTTPTSNLAPHKTTTHNDTDVASQTIQLQLRREPPLGILLGSNLKRSRPTATSFPPFPTFQTHSQPLCAEQRPQSHSGLESDSDSDEPLSRKLKRRCVSEGIRVQEPAGASGSQFTPELQLASSAASAAPASMGVSEDPNQPTSPRDCPLTNSSSTRPPTISAPAVISPRRSVYAQPPSPPWMTESSQTLDSTSAPTPLSASSSLAHISSSCSHLSAISPSRLFRTDPTGPEPSPAFKLRQVPSESTSPSPSVSPTPLPSSYPPREQPDEDPCVSGTTTGVEIAVSASLSIPTPGPSPGMQSLPALADSPGAATSLLFQRSGGDRPGIELASSLLASQSTSSPVDEECEPTKSIRMYSPPSVTIQTDAIDPPQLEESKPSNTTATNDETQDRIQPGATLPNTRKRSGATPSREAEDDSEPPSSQSWSITEELIQPTSSPPPEGGMEDSDLVTPRLCLVNLGITHSPSEPELKSRVPARTPTSDLDRARSPLTEPTAASAPKIQVTIPRVLVENTPASLGMITPTPSVSSEGDVEERSARSTPTPVTSTLLTFSSATKQSAEDNSDETRQMTEDMESVEEGEITPAQLGAEQQRWESRGEPEEGEVVVSSPQDATFASLPPVPDSPLLISPLPLPLPLPLPSLDRSLSSRPQEEGEVESAGQGGIVVLEKDIHEEGMVGDGGYGKSLIATHSPSTDIVSGVSHSSDGDQSGPGPSTMDTTIGADEPGDVRALTMDVNEANVARIADAVDQTPTGSPSKPQEQPADGRHRQSPELSTVNNELNPTNDQNDPTPSLITLEGDLQSRQHPSPPATPPVDLEDEESRGLRKGSEEVRGDSTSSSAGPSDWDVHAGQPDDIPATPRHVSPNPDCGPVSPLSDLSALTDDAPLSPCALSQSPARPPSHVTSLPSLSLSQSGHDSSVQPTPSISMATLSTQTSGNLTTAKNTYDPSISPTKLIRDAKASRMMRMKEYGLDSDLDLDDDDDEDLIRPVKKKKTLTTNGSSSADPHSTDPNTRRESDDMPQRPRYRRNRDVEGPKMTEPTTRIRRTKTKTSPHPEEAFSAPVPSSNKGKAKESLSQGIKEKKRKRGRPKSPGGVEGLWTKVSAKAERLSPDLPSFNSAASNTSRQSRKSRRPRKVKIDWPALGDPEDTFTRGFIACDSCRGWFHYGCIGITDEGHPYLQPDAAFLCPFCVDSSDMVDRGEGEDCKRPDCNQPSQSLETDGLFVVAYILGRRPKAVGRTKLDQFSYLIKWEGYNVHECTWEGIDVFTGDPKLFIDEFQQSALAQDITLPDYDEDKPPLSQVILLQEAIDHGWMARVEADSVWLDAFGRAL